MAPPEVSILIPAYSERHFGQALASARAQTHPSFEIVVCDDSPGEAIRDLVTGAGDARVRYVKNDPRRGFEGNFTFCLAEARGELVKFLNDDDRLRPDCVARLAAAFAADARLALATSRRVVIDAAGAVQRDTPATTPISHATCTIDGAELADLVLVNGLNLIGEPTTAMFRRRDLAIEAGGLFTWQGKSYRCLADLSLWLRLLARGPAYYYAGALSEYRVHSGQEQRAADMGIACITERLDLARAAREAGFLAQPAQYHAALQRVEALASLWRERPGTPPDHVDALAAFSRTIAAEAARVPRG
jgi:glycosyltransferase involved in cell wall biosynthesis